VASLLLVSCWGLARCFLNDWVVEWGFAGSQLPCWCACAGQVYISAAVTAVAGLGWQVGCSDEAAVWCRCVLDLHPVWIGEMAIGGDALVSGFDCDA